MLDHTNLVTYPWLIGTGIAMLSIFIGLMLAIFSGKAEKAVCNERHEKLDTVVKEIKETIAVSNNKLDDIKNSVVRIETILNGRSK